MSDDIEDLKKVKIPAPEEGRVALPTMGGLPPSPDNDLTEAFGGSGIVPDAPIDTAAVETAVRDAIKTVYDPEIPVNIYDLGLIYGVDVEPDGKVEVRMTLTAPGCPVSGMLVKEVAEKSGGVEGVSTSHVELVWDPPWTKERMTEEAMLELGLI